MDRPELASLRFWLNGHAVSVRHPHPRALLVDYLRETGHTGAKIACGQGGCGACTVMLSRYDAVRAAVTHRSVNACLRPLCSVDGMAVTTVEGIGSYAAGLNPVQRAIAEGGGSQCGFCTPGFVMSMHTLLRNKPTPGPEEVENAFDGNLCRCTGYRAILDSMHACASHRAAPAAPDPPLEKLRAVRFEEGGCAWIRPDTLDDLLRIHAELRAAGTTFMLVAGHTSAGVYPNDADCFLDVEAVDEWRATQVNHSGIRIGSAVTIAEMERCLYEAIPRAEAYQTRGIAALLELLPRIACHQVRNAGTVAGNLCMARSHFESGMPFPSDLFTILMTLGASVTFAPPVTPKGLAKAPAECMLEAMPLPTDPIASIHIPYTGEREHVRLYKVARREQNAHAIVNAGLRAGFDGRGAVSQATLVFGGVARAAVRMPRTEAALMGNAWNQAAMERAAEVLAAELQSVGRAWPDDEFPLPYRITLARNIFVKLFLGIAADVNPGEVPEPERSAEGPFRRPISKGENSFTLHQEEYPVGEPLMKRTAFIQATGEARYTADLPLPPGTLHAAMVKSAHARAQFTFAPNLTALAAAKFPGYRGFFSAADVPQGGQNLNGIANDDPVFADGEATCVGAPLAIVLCTSANEAGRAAAFIESEAIRYRPEPAVLTLGAAIAAGNVFPQNPPTAPSVSRIESLTRPGSNQEWLENPTKPLDGAEAFHGVQESGAQAQFYMEPQATLAVPGDMDHITLYVSTQDPASNQAAAAAFLAIPASSVTVNVDRVGGGFGGKQTRSAFFSCAAALAASKLRKPVSLVLDRAVDMLMVGKRHPYRGEYHAASAADGSLLGLTTQFQSDGGNTYDLSLAVMDLTQLHADSVYHIPTFQTHGAVYRTNYASNTAMRSFGTIQCFLIQEDAIEQAAHRLQLRGHHILPEAIRRKALYRTAGASNFDTTHYGQELQFCDIAGLWDDLWRSSEFAARERETRAFNRAHRWRKRGISMTPAKYGISYSSSRATLNQAGALINVYADDGSVLLHHGGVELGQGIDTKMAQIAAETLGIPIKLIRVAGNTTDAVPNSIATAASTGTDLNGGAVAEACHQLRRRLEEFCRNLEEFAPHKAIVDWRSRWTEKWTDIVTQANVYRINLASQALYRTTHYSSVDNTHRLGHPFLYFVYAAAASEVEIDVLTGETVILRSDMLYDAARSINPALDVGQVQGGFIQGAGHILTEEIIYRADGSLLTDNTWTYKPPCSKTIPLDFRVRLADSAGRAVRDERISAALAVKGSKAVGEPPLVLAASVFFAVKHAVAAARMDRGYDRWFHLPAPATVQRILEACGAGADHGGDE